MLYICALIYIAKLSAMVSVRFYYERKNVYLNYYMREEGRCKVLVHSGINKSEWSSSKQRAKASYRHESQLNELLNSLVSFVEETVLDHKIKGEYLTAYSLKDKIKKRIHGSTPNEFKDYADAWISAHEARVTKYSYYSIKRSIYIFIDMYPDLTFNHIGRGWHQKTYEILIQKYSQNSVYKYFKFLRKLLKDAHIDELHNNVFYQSSGFCGKEVDVDNIYITIDDIRKIYNSLEHGDDRLRNAGILFLRACLTGVRYGSIDRLDKAMRYTIGDNEMISIITNKTTAKVSIPLSPMLSRLLDMPAKIISNQKLNQYIKELCANIGIENAEKITVHTARRTFASNMVLAGVDVPTIMAITGHKTERVFWKYVKLQPDMRAAAGAVAMRSMFA
jgi:integrase